MWLPLLDKARTALLAPSDEVKVQMEMLKGVDGVVLGIPCPWPGMGWDGMGFLYDYRTFWLEADGAAMAEMADKLVILDSACDR